MTARAGEDRTSEFPPHVLQQYSLLADGERGVLVGPRGDYVWMCAPHWDSDAVFSSLIGGGGLYAVTPVDPRFVWGGYYENGSLIWHSRWLTSTGIIECREALAFPGDPRKAVLLRRIMAIDAPAVVRVVLDARAGFGTRKMVRLSNSDGRWNATTGDLHLRWSGAGHAKPAHEGGLECLIELAPGEHHDLVLEMSDHSLIDEPVEAASAWHATESAWSTTMPLLEGTLAPREVRDAYAILRGLTSAGNGMVAAATMALPERADANRNYDYRYVWLRDQAYTGQAIAAHGAHPLLDSAVDFVTDRIAADGSQLKPAYTVTGGPVPSERRLSHLAGYPGGSDKVGNWVNHQFQLDVFGEALLLYAAAARHDHLDRQHWQAVEAVAKAIEHRWTEPDAGLWELDNRHWTHSRLICVAGLRAISATGAPSSEAAAWSSLADSILANVGSTCVHPSGRWKRATDDERVDAALLLPTIRGAIEARDPRAVATLETVQRELGSSGYVYRFRHGDGPLEDAEGAFALCGFIMSLAVHQQNDPTAAVGWFERHKAACGPPGLFAEEFDVRERQLRGNLPQAFVHALLFETATRLAKPWDAP